MAISISYPQNQTPVQHVAGTFYAWGAKDAGCTINVNDSKVTQGGNEVGTKALLHGDDNAHTHWAFRFTGLPAGPQSTLIVKDSNNSMAQVTFGLIPTPPVAAVESTEKC